MSLDENKAGAAAVDPSDFNTVVDAIVTLQANGGGGGGTPSGFKAVRFPLTFDTPGLVPATYAITAFDEPTQMITVAGDRTAALAPGVAVVITNDGFGVNQGSVVSSAFAAGETVVTLTGGTLLFEVTPLTVIVAVGATVYTPAVGDMLLGSNDSPITMVSVSEAWDGTTPTLRVLTESYRQSQSQPFVTVDATVQDNPDALAPLQISAPPGFTVGTAWRLWRFTTADPILVQVDDNNGLDPGASQGAAEVVLLVVTA